MKTTIATLVFTAAFVCAAGNENALRNGATAGGAQSTASAEMKVGTSRAKPKISPAYRRTGGMLRRPGVKEGRIAVFTAQDAVPATQLEPATARLARRVHADMPVLGALAADIATVRGKLEAMRKAGAEFAIFVVDDVNESCSLGIFPDQHFATVNIAPLRPDGGEGVYLFARARKQVVRAFLTLCGGASSMSPGNIMGGLRSLRELDDYADDAIPVDVIGRTLRFLPEAGCNIRTLVPYRTAVREGWAPEPTNDVQRAIWEQIRADKERGPARPIRISPPAPAK